MVILVSMKLVYVTNESRWDSVSQNVPRSQWTLISHVHKSSSTWTRDYLSDGAKLSASKHSGELCTASWKALPPAVKGLTLRETRLGITKFKNFFLMEVI